LNQLQKELLRAHPKVNFRLNYRRSDQVYDDVILGAADLGLVAYPQARAGVDIVPFREDKLAVVMAPGHALASKAKIAMSSVIGLPFVAFDREAPSRKGIDKLFRDKGFEIQPTMEMDNVETIKRAVELGLGISVLPTPTVAHELNTGTLVAKPFVEGAFTRPIGILVRKGKYLSRASQAVLDAFRQTAIEE
jgi:DNA-binding transcriptional LysR family regulator